MFSRSNYSLKTSSADVAMRIDDAAGVNVTCDGTFQGCQGWTGDLTESGKRSVNEMLPHLKREQ